MKKPLDLIEGLLLNESGQKDFSGYIRISVKGALIGWILDVVSPFVFTDRMLTLSIQCLWFHRYGSVFRRIWILVLLRIWILVFQELD
jgi:hypothetical protein